MVHGQDDLECQNLWCFRTYGLKNIINHNIGRGLSKIRNYDKEKTEKTFTMPNPKDSFAGFLKGHE